MNLDIPDIISSMPRFNVWNPRFHIRTYQTLHIQHTTNTNTSSNHPDKGLTGFTWALLSIFTAFLCLSISCLAISCSTNQQVDVILTILARQIRHSDTQIMNLDLPDIISGHPDSISEFILSWERRSPCFLDVLLAATNDVQPPKDLKKVSTHLLAELLLIL